MNAFSPGESGAASRGSGMVILAPANNDVVIGAAAMSASLAASIMYDDAIACGQSGSDEQSDVPNESVQMNLEAAVKLESAGDSVIQQMFAMAKHNPRLETRMDAYDGLRALMLATHPNCTQAAQEAQTAVAALEDQGMLENCPVNLYVHSPEGTSYQRACSGKYSLVAKWIASPAGYPL